MKLSAALVLAFSGLAAGAAQKSLDISASQKVGGKTVRKLVRAARKLEDNNQNNNNNNNQEQDEWSYLAGYNMKFVQCVPDYQVAGDDGYESSAIIFRLCPADVESESAFGCTDEEAYGDYVVGIQTYTRAVIENMQQEAENNGNNNNNNGQDEDLNEYSECREFDMEEYYNNNGQNNNQNDQGRKLEQNYYQSYYVGPKCVDLMSANGKKVVGSDIAVGFFSDMYCSTETDAPVTLPYANGGLGGQFTGCSFTNENYETEIREMCQELVDYENVALRCDPSYQGGCDAIEELEAELKKAESKSGAGKVFLIIVLVLAVLGGVYYFLKKKKESSATEGEAPVHGGFFSRLC